MPFQNVFRNTSYASFPAWQCRLRLWLWLHVSHITQNDFRHMTGYHFRDALIKGLIFFWFSDLLWSEQGGKNRSSVTDNMLAADKLIWWQVRSSMEKKEYEGLLSVKSSPCLLLITSESKIRQQRLTAQSRSELWLTGTPWNQPLLLTITAPHYLYYVPYSHSHDF